MLNIIRLAKNMQDEPKAHFLIVGDGDEVNTVKKSIEDNHLKNVTLLPLVSNDVHSDMLNEFDVGLISLHRNHTTHNIPGKLLKFMSSSKPILGSVNNGNDLLTMIPEYDSGFITINGDDDGFKTNAIKMMNEGIRKRLGSNSRKLFVDYFTTERAVTDILKMYHGLNI